METATLSTKFQLVIPRGPRECLRLQPGMKFTVIDKGGVIYLVPERPARERRGIAKGVNPRGLREKKERLSRWRTRSSTRRRDGTARRS